MTSTDQLQAQCNRIANDIRNPPTYEQSDLVYLAEENKIEPTKTVSAMDYLYNAFDIELTYGYGNNFFAGGSVAVALGGPNIYITTNASSQITVMGYWGSDKYEVSATDNLGIDDYLEELHNSQQESK